MGPNGSGKTTAAELISGLQEPTRGWVRIAGFSLDHEAEALARGNISATFPTIPTSIRI